MISNINRKSNIEKKEVAKNFFSLSSIQNGIQKIQTFIYVLSPSQIVCQYRSFQRTYTYTFNVETG